MKLAIVHDSYVHVGGAEKVLDTLIDMYPNADIFIPIVNLRLFKKKHPHKKIYSSLFSYLPFFYKFSSLLKPICIIYFEHLHFTKYDVVLTSSHSFNSKIVSTQTVPHISYIHTPPRYLDPKLFNELQIIHNPFFRQLLKPLLSWLKKKDQESGTKPNLLIANSINTQKRILSRYSRHSIVIYPPIKIPQSIIKNDEKHYLIFSRLVKQKGIDLAIKAFNINGKPLIVVGTGPELTYLQSIAQKNITFLGYVSDENLSMIFSKTKAMINCAIDEDFGMVTIEALAHGIPLIAYYSGGLKETVIEAKTGVFFFERTPEAINNALEKFSKSKINSLDCIQSAQKYSKKIFEKKMKTVIKAYIK